jgi:tryptophan synthase alpha chain
MPENRITRLMQQDKKLEALQKQKADIIELGMPYSDPIGDGPVIQHAAHVAIRNGVNVETLLGLVRRARKGDGCAKIKTPILLMGYSNPLISYGGDCFMADAVEAGVDGLLIPDLPPEESKDFLERARGFGLTVVYLISPTTPTDRIELIDSLSTDFSYCVAVNATTGTAKLDNDSMDANIEEYLKRVREHSKKKFVVGFGIRDRKRIRRMWEMADGAVVGSALLEHVAGAGTPEETARLAGEFWKSLR